MKRLWIISTILLLISACSANNNNEYGQSIQPQSQIGQTGQSQVGQSQTRQTRINYNMDRRGNDVGLGLDKLGITDQFSAEEMVPSEPDMDREAKVHEIVAESERYVGQKMDEFKYVQQVFSKAGYDGVVINYSDLSKVGQVAKEKMQPGDILYFDLNGDRKVDHHAIKLGNGEIIHVNGDGKVQITDILQEPEWKQKIVHVQRVF